MIIRVRARCDWDWRTFWKRELICAQKLFRRASAKSSDRMQNLRHIVSALLPMPVYRGMISLADRRRGL